MTNQLETLKSGRIRGTWHDKTLPIEERKRLYEEYAVELDNEPTPDVDLSMFGGPFGGLVAVSLAVVVAVVIVLT